VHQRIHLASGIRSVAYVLGVFTAASNLRRLAVRDEASRALRQPKVLSIRAKRVRACENVLRGVIRRVVDPHKMSVRPSSERDPRNAGASAATDAFGGHAQLHRRDGRAVEGSGLESLRSDGAGEVKGKEKTMC